MRSLRVLIINFEMFLFELADAASLSTCVYAGHVKATRIKTSLYIFISLPHSRLAAKYLRVFRLARLDPMFGARV